MASCPIREAADPDWTHHNGVAGALTIALIDLIPSAVVVTVRLPIAYFRSGAIETPRRSNPQRPR